MNIKFQASQLPPFAKFQDRRKVPENLLKNSSLLFPQVWQWILRSSSQESNIELSQDRLEQVPSIGLMFFVWRKNRTSRVFWLQIVEDDGMFLDQTNKQTNKKLDLKKSTARENWEQQTTAHKSRWIFLKIISTDSRQLPHLRSASCQLVMDAWQKRTGPPVLLLYRSVFDRNRNRKAHLNWSLLNCVQHLCSHD